MRSGARVRASAALATWATTMAVALWGLLRLGPHGGSPPLAEPDAWADWFGARHPLDAAAAIGRLLAIALVVYLLASTALELAGAVRRPRHGAAHRRQRIGRVPAFVATLVATAVASSPVGAAGPSAPDDPSNPIAPGQGAFMDVAPVEPPALPWATPPDSTSPDTTAPEYADPAEERPPESAPAPGAAAIHPSTWTVQAGDHLWSIAERTLHRRLDRQPTDAETAPYWRRLVDANRDRLVDPDDADLILPGQTLVLPN